MKARVFVKMFWTDILWYVYEKNLSVLWNKLFSIITLFLYIFHWTHGDKTKKLTICRCHLEMSFLGWKIIVFLFTMTQFADAYISIYYTCCWAKDCVCFSVWLCFHVLLAPMTLQRRHRRPHSPIVPYRRSAEHEGRQCILSINK